jgi:hypothetical protein
VLLLLLKWDTGVVVYGTSCECVVVYECVVVLREAYECVVLCDVY